MSKGSEQSYSGKDRSTDDHNSRLDSYREEIRGITRSIFDLVQARQELSLKIGVTKNLLGQSIENPEVEQELVRGMRDYAAEIGLDEEIAESIVLQLIDASKIAQCEKLSLEKIRSNLRSNNVNSLSIVGTGRMGTWFAEYFLQSGLNVTLFDQNKELARKKSEEVHCDVLDRFDELIQSDLVLIAVPIVATPGLVRKLSRLMNAKRNGSKKVLRVAEISSVKSAMAAANLFGSDNRHTKSLSAQVELYSLHPIFGRNAQKFGENAIVQVYPKDTNFVRQLFPHFRVYQMDWKSHDELMSMILTLPHALALVFAETLFRQGAARKIPKGLSGPSYERLTDLSKRLLAENPDVYFEIQKVNPYSSKALKEAISSLGRLRSSMRNKAAFREFFLEGKEGVTG